MSDRASIRNIVKLSIPIFFANLVIPLVAIVDTGLMGNLDNASYLTATSIATSIFSLIFWSFGFLRMGTVGLVAQAHGSEKYEEIVNLVFRNITIVTGDIRSIASDVGCVSFYARLILRYISNFSLPENIINNNYPAFI